MTDLAKLKEQVETLGEQVKTLKAAGNKEAIGAAVAALLAAKKDYAAQNNGIGVDGKPYEEPLTKAQKKAKAKAEKAATPAGPAKQDLDPNSKGAQKKAEKKAAKAAAKQAHKSGDAPPPAAAATGGKAAAAAFNRPAQQKQRPPVITTTKVQSMQLVLNPNLPLNERPVVALALAVMENVVLDYQITPNHKARHGAYLGLPNGAGTIVGDFAIAQYILRKASTTSTCLDQNNSWVNYAQSMMRLPLEQVVVGVASTLEHALKGRTYLVGHSLSLADLAVFSTLGFPSQASDRKTVLAALPQDAKATRRWLEMVASSPAVMEATQLAMTNQEADFTGDDALAPLAPGMNLLEGALPGRVVTRFPPEPSGYLHIGHAKAVLLNDFYARRYRGRLIVRFDDTNPSKEKEEFQTSIIEDLAKLGVKPDLVTFTSDYFDTITKYAESIINDGLAFMDDTPQEQMKEERMARTDSKHRNQSPEEAMKLFKLMCSGSEEGSSWCLRAKIDMQSVNGTLRDPVLFRQNLEPHHRSGTKYKAYPTYDFACPIVDSLEGVTHALRTTEYNDRDEQYQWMAVTLGLRRVRIHAFSRVNFTYTVMSKRKLAWFVNSGSVTGWDDPRFPTVRGVVRRGINVTALRNFMYSQGASRNIVNMVWSKFWAENKKEIDKTAKRFMAIDSEKQVKLKVTNGPSAESNSFLTTDFHPKDASLGKRTVRIANEVWLESVDTEGMQVGEEIVLIRWGVMKLTQVEGGLEATFVPNGDLKQAKRKLSWIANVTSNTPCTLTEYDNLVTKEKLEEDDNFQDFLNPNTIATTTVIGDPGLKMLQRNNVIQLERRGFYRVDAPYVSNEKPIVLIMVPDGKSKAMGGLVGKLAHS